MVVIAAIGIKVGPEGHVKIIVQYFIISQSFQPEAGLVVGRKLRRQQSGMATLCKWEKAKGNIDWDRYAFKLRMDRTGDRHLFIDDRHPVGRERKVWRGQVSLCEKYPDFL